MHLHTPLGKRGVGSSNENNPRGLNDWCYQIWPFWNRLLKTNSFSSIISSCFVEPVNTFMSVKEWVWVVIKLRFRTFSAWLDTICIGRQICKKNFCLSHSMVCHFFSIWHGREGGWSKKLQSVTWVKGGGKRGGSKKLPFCEWRFSWIAIDF